MGREGAQRKQLTWLVAGALEFDCALESPIVAIPGIPGLGRDNPESKVILDMRPCFKNYNFFFYLWMLGPFPDVMDELTFGCFKSPGDTNAQ